MKITIYKDNLIRQVVKSDLESYLAAGWQEKQARVETKTQPKAISKVAETIDLDNAIEGEE